MVTSDERPDTCSRCVFCCPWNGQGWGCAHDSVFGLLHGVCQCKGKYFLQYQPFRWPMAGGDGIEPPFAESKSAVLPLDDPPN